MILDRWQSHAIVAGQVTVYPDGCRDVIWIAMPGMAPAWVLSPLDAVPRLVSAVAGTKYLGFRLQPGVRIRSALFAAKTLDDPDTAAETISAHCDIAAPVAEVLAACMALGGGRVATLAQALSVSRRSLERLLTAQTGQGPGFSLRLARARRSLRDVMDHMPLAEVAAANGFADQAHMTREFRQWFGDSPLRLYRSPTTTAAILGAGFGV